MPSPGEELREAKSRLFTLFSKGELNTGFQESYTNAVDNYFRRTIQESEVGQNLFKGKNKFAIIAVGGYGREELCLHSDIDIIILFKSKIPPNIKGLAEDIFYPLWNIGFDLGHGIRNIKDCLSLSANDFEVLTSLLDSRFLCGDSPIFLSLMEILGEKVMKKKEIAFYRWLEEQDEIRLETKGDARYLLEPNLKDGIGGLRDYHHILWLARVFFNIKTTKDLEYSGKLTHKEYRELVENLHFIRHVRNHLHQISKRKNDRLNFEYQEEISKKLGYSKKNGLLAVEQFMGKLHNSMTAIHSLHRSFIYSHIGNGRKRAQQALETNQTSNGVYLENGQWFFNSATTIINRPVMLMEIFKLCSQGNDPLSLEAKRLISEFLYLVDESFRESRDAAKIFLSLLEGRHAHTSLDQMFETGFLEAYIPEFGKIKDRVQFGTYHIYPVGKHILETIKHLNEIPIQRDFILLDIFNDLQNPVQLFLAGLFHDIGKTGKGHARRGASIAGRIMKRMGYGEDDIKEVEFLVKNHLILAETATRRDLNDEKVIVQSARKIMDIERLKMLYLLTWADSKATGPRAWNEWIANLVQELFFKILHTIERGELATPDASKRVKNTMSMVKRLLSNKVNQKSLDSFFDVLSPRYILEINPKDLIRHFEIYSHFQSISQNVNQPAFRMDAKEVESEGCWEMTLIAKDSPGLFADIAGVFALNNINILSSHIYTWRDATAVDIFKVTKPLDTIHPNKIWDKVERDLKSTFTGKLYIDYRLSKKAETPILTSSKKSFSPPVIKIDNESSDFFTIVEVFADDSIGLLYHITHTLFKLRLDIKIAKIATKGNQIADVFYVRDFEGQKVEDKAHGDEIKAALTHQITKISSPN